jgi:hypothetical protein
MGATTQATQAIQSSTATIEFPRLWSVVILSTALLAVSSQVFAQNELSAGDLVFPQPGIPGALPSSIELNTSGDVGLATAGGSGKQRFVQHVT